MKQSLFVYSSTLDNIFSKSQWWFIITETLVLIFFHIKFYTLDNSVFQFLSTLSGSFLLFTFTLSYSKTKLPTN